MSKKTSNISTKAQKNVQSVKVTRPKINSIDIETFMTSTKIKKQFTMLEDSHEADAKDQTKPVDIDEINDTKDEIIKKLVHMVRYLLSEIEEHKTYTEGTYCSLKEFYRSNDQYVDQIKDIENSYERLESRVDDLGERLESIGE